MKKIIKNGRSKNIVVNTPPHKGAVANSHSRMPPEPAEGSGIHKGTYTKEWIPA